MQLAEARRTSEVWLHWSFGLSLMESAESRPLIAWPSPKAAHALPIRMPAAKTREPPRMIPGWLGRLTQIL
jgi:hypothetical protein